MIEAHRRPFFRTWPIAVKDEFPCSNVRGEPYAEIQLLSSADDCLVPINAKREQLGPLSVALDSAVISRDGATVIASVIPYSLPTQVPKAHASHKCTRISLHVGSMARNGGER